ncbi:acetylcholine receptor subunit beta-like 1, partial [Saccostrea cucullata]|uniref:acetylcholine receptor subunit beta-like 1 n=1 Tax=Saccostrea cuccullata TaxID=36930 RepID=UPI002ED5D0DB
METFLQNKILVSFYLFFFCLLKAFVPVSADENEFRLIRDLMARYDKRIRPSVNHTIPTTVNFSVALAQIIDVDEKNQIITTNCWLNL